MRQDQYCDEIAETLVDNETANKALISTNTALISMHIATYLRENNLKIVDHVQTEPAQAKVPDMTNLPDEKPEPDSREWWKEVAQKTSFQLNQANARLLDLERETRRETLMEAIQIVQRNRRHVELSPGVGADCQRYGIAVANDIEAELERKAKEEA